MGMAGPYKIGEVAALTGVSVRTLHHYDEIGLLRPSGRSHTGYRLYAAADFERLQSVLFFRDLGFSLEAIARIVSDPHFDRRAALVSHRGQLVQELEKTRALLDLVDRTLLSIEKGQTMEPNEMFTGFEKEAEARWGRTEAYAESARRTKTYGKEEWAAIRVEADAITRDFADAMNGGATSTGARAMDIAERHRLHIDRWFYACTPRIHQSLGEMYVYDERFAQNYEKVAGGLAAYIRDAIVANAARTPTA